jgi:ferritin
MDQTLHRRLNQHLALEFGAAHKYLAMAVWFESQDLKGFASWLRTQSQEELGHAHRFIGHLVDRDLEVALPAIEQPPSAWKSAQAAVKDVLSSEQKVTAAIEALYDLALKAKDRPAQILLQWFVNEQVEEEHLVNRILGRLRLAGSDGLGLLLVDQEVGQGKMKADEAAGEAP